MRKTITLKEGQYVSQNETLEVRGIIAVLKRWIADRGFGFLILEDGSEIFCHVNELCSHLSPSQRGESPQIERGQTIYVQGVVEGRQKGKLQAENVQCECCASPDIWEIHPSENPNDVAFGVRRMVAVCVNHQYKSNFQFKHEDLDARNALYREAQRKKELFARPGGYADEFDPESYARFFEIFGQPEEIQADILGYVALNYSKYGTTKMRVDHILKGEFFGGRPTGKWEKMGDMQRTARINAEFDILGLKVQQRVGFYSKVDGGNLNSFFDKLPAMAQQEIIAALKEDMLTPEAKAREDFSEGLRYHEEYLIKLREKIVLLRSPGEASYYSETRRIQSYSAPSEDGYRPGGYYERSADFHYLNVGLRRQVLWKAQDAIQVSSDIRYRYPDPEKAKEYLLEDCQRSLLKTIDDFANSNPYFQDSRLEIMPEKEWRTRYLEGFRSLSEELRTKYAEEDEIKLASIIKDWEECDRKIAAAQAAYEQFEALKKEMNEAGVPWATQIQFELRRPNSYNPTELEEYVGQAEEIMMQMMEVIDRHKEAVEEENLRRQKERDEKDAQRKKTREDRREGDSGSATFDSAPEVQLKNNALASGLAALRDKFGN